MDGEEKTFMTIITLILLLIITISILMIGLDSKVVGEKPCVDGEGDKNLGGIMCEKTEVQYFGYNKMWSIPNILIMGFQIFFLLLCLMMIPNDCSTKHF